MSLKVSVLFLSLVLAGKLHFSPFPLPLISSHRGPAKLKAKSTNTVSYVGRLCQNLTVVSCLKEITELWERKKKKKTHKTGLKHSNSSAMLDSKNANSIIFLDCIIYSTYGFSNRLK